jgi:hypothetical protein
MREERAAKAPVLAPRHTIGLEGRQLRLARRDLAVRRGAGPVAAPEGLLRQAQPLLEVRADLRACKRRVHAALELRRRVGRVAEGPDCLGDPDAAGGRLQLRRPRLADLWSRAERAGLRADIAALAHDGHPAQALHTVGVGALKSSTSATV